MASESKISVATSTVDPPVEIPLTQDPEKYLKKFEEEILLKEKKILEKGTLTPEERTFLGKKMSIEKKLMSGGYESLYEMACDINDGRPSKEIGGVIFKNMMKIMLPEFNA